MEKISTMNYEKFYPGYLENKERSRKNLQRTIFEIEATLFLHEFVQKMFIDKDNSKFEVKLKCQLNKGELQALNSRR